LHEARARGEVFAEPVVTVLTSTGLKEMPAPSVLSHATALASLDSVIVSLLRA